MSGHGRLLSREHFAFARALTQGLDPAQAWSRYLQIEGTHTDARIVRRTIAWLRDTFVSVAKRQGRPGTARLIRLDPDALRAAAAKAKPSSLPTLEEFTRDRDLAEFSEVDQLAAFAEAFGTQRKGRQRNLIARQLEALTWLEGLAAQSPGPGDAVSAWFPAGTADRLEAFGIKTLFALVERINGMGMGWHNAITSIGAAKAARIVEWLRIHQDSIGLRVGAHAVRPISEVALPELALVVPQATALVPLEKLAVPAAVSGAVGRYRAPQDQCLLSASTDYEAIQAWLASKHATPSASAALTATQRSYRREAERLLLWAVLERRTALSSLTVEDVRAFMDFLAAPPAQWCSPAGAHAKRWSPLWRPLDGPLSAASAALAFTILRSLFAWLIGQRYLVANPFAALPKPRSTGARALGAGRSLTRRQWAFVVAQLDKAPSTEAIQRLRLALPWLYALGLRRAELCAARCGDLERFEYQDADGAQAQGWLQMVRGKGGKLREVPLPPRLVQQLGQRLQDVGRETDPTHPENRDAPIIFRRSGEDVLPIEGHRLYKDVRDFFQQCAAALGSADPAGAARLRAASTHWMRHTSATHQVNGGPGQEAVPMHIVQQVLGHASPATTGLYVHAERDQRVRAMQGFWNSA